VTQSHTDALTANVMDQWVRQQTSISMSMTIIIIVHFHFDLPVTGTLSINYKGSNSKLYSKTNVSSYVYK